MFTVHSTVQDVPVFAKLYIFKISCSMFTVHSTVQDVSVFAKLYIFKISCSMFTVHSTVHDVPVFAKLYIFKISCTLFIIQYIQLYMISLVHLAVPGQDIVYNVQPIQLYRMTLFTLNCTFVRYRVQCTTYSTVQDDPVYAKLYLCKILCTMYNLLNCTGCPCVR